MPTLPAGCDRSITYARLDPHDLSTIEDLDAGTTTTRPARVKPTINRVTAKLNGQTLELTHEPTWDDTAHRIEDGIEQGQEFVLELDGSTLVVGELAITYQGTDPAGGAFKDTVTYLVLADDGPEAALIYRVTNFLRLEATDPTIPPLVDAAIAYLENAGVTRPADSEGKQVALYELAVTLYVNTIFSDGEDKLEDAMTSIVWQLKL
jgi:hypothetical protein